MKKYLQNVLRHMDWWNLYGNSSTNFEGFPGEFPEYILGRTPWDASGRILKRIFHTIPVVISTQSFLKYYLKIFLKTNKKIAREPRKILRKKIKKKYILKKSTNTKRFKFFQGVLQKMLLTFFLKILQGLFRNFWDFFRNSCKE